MTDIQLNLAGIALSVASVVGHTALYFRWLQEKNTLDDVSKAHLVLAITLGALFATACVVYVFSS